MEGLESVREEGVRSSKMVVAVERRVGWGLLVGMEISAAVRCSEL